MVGSYVTVSCWYLVHTVVFTWQQRFHRNCFPPAMSTEVAPHYLSGSYHKWRGFKESWVNKTTGHTLVAERRFQLAGHILHLASHWHSNIAIGGHQLEEHAKGRPKKTWKRTFQENLRQVYILWDEAKTPVGVWQIMLVESCCLMCFDVWEELSLSK